MTGSLRGINSRTATYANEGGTIPRGALTIASQWQRDGYGVADDVLADAVMFSMARCGCMSCNEFE